MPGQFEKYGVKFLYPENWNVAEESDPEEESWPKVISVQSPGGSFWTLHVYEGGVNIRSLVREAVEAIREEYHELEEEELLTCDDGADYGYDLHFYYLDLLVTARVRALLRPGQALLWILQGESRDFDTSEPIFQAMILSMLGKIPPIARSS
jgi:hypothetical protein